MRANRHAHRLKKFEGVGEVRAERIDGRPRRRLDGPSAHPGPKKPLTPERRMILGRSGFGLADALYLQVEPEPPSADAIAIR